MTTAKNTQKLPPHLQALVEKIEVNNKKWGFLDFSKIDRSKLNDFHPLHGLIG